MRSTIIILLLCLSTNLFAQVNDYNLVEKEIRSLPDEEGKDSIFNYLFFKYAWYKPDSGLYYSKKEALMARQLHSLLMESRALTRYGYLLGMTGNYPQGIDYLLRMHKVAQQIQDTTWLFMNCVALTEIYTDQGDTKQAKYYANKITEVPMKYYANKIIEVPIVDMVQYPVRMALIYQRTGQADSALLYARIAFNKGIEQTGKTDGFITLSLADSYFINKMYDSALHYYKMALALTFERSYQDYRDLILIYNGIAEVYKHYGQIDSSYSYAYKSFDLRVTNSYPVGTLATYRILYNLFKQQGKTDSAIQYLERTIALQDNLFNQQKEREVQNIAFNERLRQEEETAQQIQFQNRFKLYILLCIAIAFIVIALLLLRNNRHRQRAYALLQEQKRATDKQKEQTEKALQDLKSTQAQLIQSEKMASLGQLTAGIAHEIQNPLNFVNNFSEVNMELISEMKEEIDKGNYGEVKSLATDVEENEEKIIHHGKRAGAIVKGMLQHSKASSGKKELTDINALVDESVRLSFHGVRAKDKEFNTDIKTDLDTTNGKINVVPQDISRVMLNLLNNAFYAVSEAPTQKGENYEPTVWVTTKHTSSPLGAEGLLITVKDNGTGIPQNIIDKVFQPFFTTKPTGQGTGLGLSLSYDIVKAHGGELKVESKEGEGSEFIIYLPL